MRPLAIALLMSCMAMSAQAHPHVWVEATVEFQVTDGHLVGVGHRWRFDDVFSDFLLAEFDQDADLRFDAQETARIRDEAFSLLEEFNYFTDLRQDGVRVATKVADGLEVTVDPVSRVVTYRFATPMPSPVPLNGPLVTLALYDDSFYVDIGLSETDPVRFAGIAGCGYEIREDPDIALLGGLYHPRAAWITCAGS